MRCLLVGFCHYKGQFLAGGLSDHGHTVEIAPCKEEAHLGLGDGDYQAMLVSDRLDGRLPLEFIASTRRQAPDVPIILVSQDVLPAERVAAFEMGADDCVSLDMNLAELSARICNAARRFHSHATQVIEVGPLAISLGTKRIEVAGEPIELANKEYQVLELLALKRGQIVRRSSLVEHLYRGADEPENSGKILDIMVFRIRKKIDTALAGSSTRADQIIRTVRMMGFVLEEPAEFRKAA